MTKTQNITSIDGLTLRKSVNLYTKHITENRMKKDPFYDPKRTWEGNVFSTFLSYYEEMILEQIFLYLRTNRYIKDDECVLCFDGIMIRKEGINDIPKLLKDLEDMIYYVRRILFY